MKKQVIVIGLGRFGVTLADTLYSIGHDVLAIDKDEKIIQAVTSKITHAIQADGTNEAILKELGVGNFDIAIVAMGSAIESNVLCTILLKKMGVPFVIARANNQLHGSILDKIGADRVVFPEQEMGDRVAHSVVLGDVSDYMSVAPRYGITKLVAPQYFVGSSLSKLEFGYKGKWEVAVLLIQRGKEVIVNPSQREVINSGDVLIVTGNDDKLEKLLSEAKKAKEE